MLCPVAVTAAFPHDQKDPRHERTIVVNNKKVPVVDQIFWAGYSGVTYLPSTAAPIGQTADGLPIGVQIVGPQYGDYSTHRRSPSCWRRNIAASCRHRPTAEKDAMSKDIDLKKHIRSIPDFPKPGILFYDISTLLAHAKAWHDDDRAYGRRDSSATSPTSWPASNRAASCWRRRSPWRSAPAS